MEYQIFPAYAGLNLSVTSKIDLLSNIPRIRGVEPKTEEKATETDVYSPHTRG